MGKKKNGKTREKKEEAPNPKKLNLDPIVEMFLKQSKALRDEDEDLEDQE